MGVDKIHGSLLGIKKAKQDQIARLYRRRVPADEIVTQELSRELTGLSHELGKQIGVLINRRGQVEQVMVGDKKTIMLPELGRSRGDRSRFRRQCRI